MLIIDTLWPTLRVDPAVYETVVIRKELLKLREWID